MMGNMFESRLLWLAYCLLLFLAGMIFGFIFNKQGEVTIIAFLGALASLATVAASITAIIALTSWKAQFRLQKKYDSVIAMRAYTHSASNPLMHLASLLDHYSKYVRTMDDKGLATEYPYDKQKIWFDHISEFGKAWDFMSVHLSESEIALLGCSPASLDDMVCAARKRMADHAFDFTSLDTESTNIRLIQISKVYNDCAEQIHEAYEKLEVQSRYLLRHLAS